MKLQITCPECGKQSLIESSKVPLGKLKTTCHSCNQKFFIDKGQNLNCRLIQAEAAGAADEPEGNWKIDRPEFEGIEYETSGVGGLIRSGMVTPATRVLAPGAKQFQEAGKLESLRKFFEQKEKRDS
ncbi:hypothetical protein [Acanthopleuribacter pedis]|uniref:Zinc finger/thioredoxin putative domain-containing protein n=1 Tax=Acanthopleuribacter pedis TaxID=442870 RepID=A0A8J7U5V2_9BACT|nr:hypothetical protein [Acanthopleuribacter pedis]MBO1321239.1 hypothetical protein [Acanthopleuribacter pedis]